MHFQFLKYFLPNSFDLHRIVSHLFCSITCQHIFWNIFFQISSICSELYSAFFALPFVNTLSEIYFSKFLQFAANCITPFLFYLRFYFSTHFLKYFFPNSFDLQQIVSHPFCSTTCQYIFWNIFFKIPSICSKGITPFLLYHSRYHFSISEILFSKFFRFVLHPFCSII